MALSEQATQALISVGTNRQGAVVYASVAANIELLALGLVGDGNGLTRKGTIARQKIMDAALDKAFG